MNYCENKSSFFVYQLDPTKYSELALSVTMEGLAKIVHRSLVGTGKFPTPRTTAVIAGERGNFAECYFRAMQSVRRIDQGAHGIFHLLRVREAVLTYTDPRTIVALDEAIGHYVRVELLAPEVQLSDRWPGSEWFLHPDAEAPGFYAPTAGPVSAAITAAMSRHLGINAAGLAVTAFNAHGEPRWTRSLSGTFVVRRISAV